MSFESIIKAGLPVLLTGKAGTGKTSSLRAFAKQNSREVVDLRVAMMPPEDLVGIPKVNGEYFSYLAPEWAAKAAHNKGAGLLIVLEEIHLAPPATHAALYQLLQEKEVAGVDLSNAWVAATANPPEQAGAAMCAELPEALRDRLELVDYKCTDKSVEWLKNLGKELEIPSDVLSACGLDGMNLPMTPRACERLLRLIAAGVRDGEIIARRAGNMSSRLMPALQAMDNPELFKNIEEMKKKSKGDILAQAATPDRAASHVVLTDEGFLDLN